MVVGEHEAWRYALRSTVSMTGVVLTSGLVDPFAPCMHRVEE